MCLRRQELLSIVWEGYNSWRRHEMKSFFKYHLEAPPFFFIANTHRFFFSKKPLYYRVPQLSIVLIDCFENFVIWPTFLSEGRPDRNP